MKYLIFLLLTCRIFSATYYIDSIATGKADGSSWANAFPTIKAAYSGVQPSSTVYISGGPSGKSQSYNGSSTDQWVGQFFSANGVTWKVGQDALHNGKVILDGMGGGNLFQHDWNGVTISGDAGDGLRHIYLKDNSTTDGVGSCGNSVNVHFTYIDFGKQPGNSGSSAFNFNPAQGVEIDHCKFYFTGDKMNQLSYGIFNGGAYKENSFHDNDITIPRGTNGLGPDALGWTGSDSAHGGFSIYNNDFKTYLSTSYSGGQHQDGWQAAQGSYIEVYGNKFTDFLNYCVFPECYLGGYSHMQIHGNTCVITFKNITQAIAISATLAFPAVDVNCYDNTATGFAIPFTFRNPNAMPLVGAFKNCAFTNNISYNGGTNIIDPSVLQSGNINYPGDGPLVPPIVTPPPVVVPPTNAKVKTSVSTVSADGKIITTTVTLE